MASLKFYDNYERASMFFGALILVTCGPCIGAVVGTTVLWEAIDRGFKGVYTAWLAIIASLKVQFAQMIALGAAIGDFLADLLRVPLTKVLVRAGKG